MVTVKINYDKCFRSQKYYVSYFLTLLYDDTYDLKERDFYIKHLNDIFIFLKDDEKKLISMKTKFVIQLIFSHLRMYAYSLRNKILNYDEIMCDLLYHSENLEKRVIGG
nr:MAG TPA: hypothetical protein [Bacteriophage sp.]